MTSSSSSSRSSPPGRVRRLRRRLGAAEIRLAGTALLRPVLQALGRYPPEPRIVAGTTRVVESYGDDPAQVGEWWLPPGAADGVETLPTVVLVHGGYWRAGYDRSLENAVAADLAGLGYLCWVPDYRPSTFPWPTTMRDAAAAVDHLGASPFTARIDPARLAIVGHSAGGHLALWLSSRHRLPAGSPPGLGLPAHSPRPALVVSQAGVAALTVAAARRLGDGASVDLIGGPPAAVDARYAMADPLRLLPTGVRTVLVHSAADDTVPIGQSETYLAAALRAGDDCTLVRVPGGHLDHLVPTSPAVAALRRSLAGLRGAR